MNVGEDGLAHGREPVRWCVTPQLIQQLKSRGFIAPHLVLAVRALSYTEYEGENGTERLTIARETSVQVVPLRAELTYVAFHRPGENEIRGFIIDGYGKDAAKQLHSLRRGFTTMLFGDDGQLFNPGVVRYMELKECVLSVEVPEEMFAKEPSERAKKLVERFYPQRKHDECDFRKHFLKTLFGRAPLLLTFGQLAKLGQAVVYAFFGIWRGVEYKSLLHPWSGQVDLENSDNFASLWFTNKDGYSRLKLGSGLLTPLTVLNPPVLLAVPNIFWGAYQIGAHSQPTGKGKLSEHASQLTYLGWWSFYWRAALALICLVAAVCLVVAIGFGVVFLFGVVSDFLKGDYAKQQARRQRQRQREATRDQELKTQEQRVMASNLASLEAMTCEYEVQNASVAALPKEKQTVRLRFEELKTKVCKPFSL